MTSSTIHLAPASSKPVSGSGGSLRGTRASDHLDMIRGLAAIAVLYCHARSLFIQSVGTQHISPVSRLFYILSNYGHVSVMIFFVLSGYLVGKSIIRDAGLGRWSWRSYLVARGTRLYLVLIPALLLTLLWDRLGLRWVAGSVGNSDTAIALIAPAKMQAHDSLLTLMGNLAFLQTIKPVFQQTAIVPSYGSDIPLWSLANEFWYYLIFPCLWLALRGRSALGWRAISFTLTLAVLFTLGTDIWSFFPIWVVGACIAITPSMKNGWKPLCAAACGFMLVILGLLGLNKIHNGLACDYAVAIAFTLALYAILHDKTPSSSGVYAHTARWLSGCSYSLYLTHVPLLIFCRNVWTFEKAWPADPPHWAMVMAVCGMAVLFAYGVSRLTEAHTDAVRRWFDRLMTPATPRALAEASDPALNGAVSAGTSG